MSLQANEDLTVSRKGCKDEGGATRRDLLAGGLSAAMLAASGLASAQSRGGFNNLGTSGTKGDPVRNEVGRVTTVSDASKDAFAKYWGNSTLRLARRISFGVSEAEAAVLRDKTFAEYLDEQLNWEQINDTAVTSHLDAHYPKWRWTADEIIRSNQLPTEFEVKGAYFHYMAFTNRQLHARMVEFWLDHFHVQMEKPGRHYMNEYVFTTIIPNSMGTFRGLLEKVLKSGAMCLYLDNHANRRGLPNINYARELLELHTVGVNGGYTEGDINEAAKILTGWVVQRSTSYPDHAKVIFRQDFHEPGTKAVMGRNFLAKNENEVKELLDYLCQKDETKAFLAGKLYRFFLGRQPRSDEQQAFNTVWNESGSDIRALLRLVLTEDNVMGSRSLYKRPMHLFLGLFRQLDMRSVDYARLDGVYLKQNGQELFEWVDPDGYPQREDHWYNNQVRRLHHMISIASDRDVKVRPGVPTLFSGVSSAEDAVTRVDQLIFMGELPTPDKIWLSRFLRGKSLTDKNLRSFFAVALGSPSYQWY